MTSLLRADLLKLRKRPMGWVMLIIIALFVPLLMLPSAFLSPGNVNYAFPAGFLEGLTPLPFVGTFIMIVLGAMLVGTEYGYDTWKNLLIRRPGRTPFILSKWSMLVVATGVGLIVLLTLGQLIGWIVDAALHLSGPAVSLSPGHPHGCDAVSRAHHGRNGYRERGRGKGDPQHGLAGAIRGCRLLVYGGAADGERVVRLLQGCVYWSLQSEARAFGRGEWRNIALMHRVTASEEHGIRHSRAIEMAPFRTSILS